MPMEKFKSISHLCCQKIEENRKIVITSKEGNKKSPGLKLGIGYLNNKRTAMTFHTNDTSRLDLSKFKCSQESEMKHTISEYQYHLRQLHASLQDVNHHLDKCNECIYLIKNINKNFNQ